MFTVKEKIETKYLIVGDTLFIKWHDNAPSGVQFIVIEAKQNAIRIENENGKKIWIPRKSLSNLLGLKDFNNHHDFNAFNLLSKSERNCYKEYYYYTASINAFYKNKFNDYQYKIISGIIN